jgi:hypothetical protein
MHVKQWKTFPTSVVTWVNSICNVLMLQIASSAKSKNLSRPDFTGRVSAATLTQKNTHTHLLY